MYLVDKDIVATLYSFTLNLDLEGKEYCYGDFNKSSSIIERKIIRFRNAGRLVDYSDQEDAVIVSVVSAYDTY